MQEKSNKHRAVNHVPLEENVVAVVVVFFEDIKIRKMRVIDNMKSPATQITVEKIGSFPKVLYTRIYT